MRWSRLILIAALVLVLLIGAGITFLFTADLSFLKSPVERAVSRAAGRTFAIEGRFEPELGRRITVLADGVRLANPEWSGDPDMVRIDRLSLAVDFWSLIDGPVVIENLEADGITVWLEETPAGFNNWTFGADAGGQDDGDLLPVILKQGLITNGRLTYASPELKQPLVMTVTSLQQTHRQDDLLDTALVGDINGRDVTVRGQVGPFESYLTGLDLRYEVTGSFDTLTIASRGYFDDVTAPRQPSVELSIKGPDVDHLTAMLGLEDLGTGNLDLDASLLAVADGLDVRVHGRLGSLVIDADGSASDLTQFRTSTLTADVQGQRLGRVLRLFGIKHVPDENFKLSAAVSREGPELTIQQLSLDLEAARFNVGGTVSRFPDLDGANLNLDINGSDIAKFRDLLGIPGVATGPFALSASINLTPEGTDILHLDASTSLARMKIDGPIGDPPDYLGTRLRFAGSGDDFQKFAEAYGLPAELAAPFALAGELEITGRGLETRQKTTLRIGDQSLSVDGVISLAPLERGTDVRFDANGPDVSKLALLADVREGLAKQPYQITGRFKAEPAGYRLDSVVATTGRGKLELDGLISRADDLVGSDITFSASGPDLEEVLADRVTFDVPTGPFNASGRIRRRPGIIRVDDLKLAAGGASLRVDADLGWPFATSSRGEFVLEAQGPDVRVALPEFETFEPDPAAFAINARGEWRGERLTFEQYTTRWGEAEVSWQGSIDQPPDLSDIDLQLTARVPDLAAIGLINGERLPAQPLELEAHFSGTPTAFQMDDMRGQIGETDFDGQFAIALDGEVPDLALQFNAEVLDLRPFLANGEGAEGEAERVDHDGRLIPDRELPLGDLRRMNAKLDITAGEVRLENTGFTDVRLDAALKNGALRIPGVSGRGARGRLDGTLELIPRNGSADLHVTVTADQLGLNLTGETAVDLERGPQYDIQLDLTGSGATLRELAGTLNGSASLISRDGGWIRNAGMQRLYADFVAQVMGAINPFSQRDPYTQIVCVAAFFQAENGTITTVPGIVGQTDKINVISRGQVDLTTEKLDLNFRTGARRGIGISAGDLVNPYIRVGGTLGNPRLAMDRRGAAISGGAAVLTGGLSIFAQAAWNRVFRSNDPCGEAIKEAEKLSE